MLLKTKTSVALKRKVIKLIKKEKRKRIQIDNTTNFFFELNTFVDFYSKDLINILNNAKFLADLNASSEINTEDLLQSFFLTPTDCKTLLKDYDLVAKIPFSSSHHFIISENRIQVKKKSLLDFTQSKSSNQFEIIPSDITKNFGQKRIKEIKLNPKDLSKVSSTYFFSDEVEEIFKKSLSNAIYRFKTPVITAEILLITLMESEGLIGSIFLKNFLERKNEWYIFRYKLIKNLYFEESHIRNDVEKNQNFFAYVLKSRLSRLEFLRLVDLDLLSLAVEFFRNRIIKKALAADLLKEVKTDVHSSALLVERKYSLN